MSAPNGQMLVAVRWDGLELMGLSDELDCIVQDVEGWYDTPPIDGHNVNRDLWDGALYGPKVFNGREVTISGTALGQRQALIGFRDQIAQRVADKQPSELVIADPWLGIELSTAVRADGEGYRHSFKGPRAFTYQIVLLAADHRRYGTAWRQAILTPATEGLSGREYPRSYPWRYAEPVLPDVAQLTNAGDLPAPVYAVYRGQLTAPRLSDGQGHTLILSGLNDGVTILVNTETLTAQAPGGASRNQWIMPNSSPLTIPPRSTATWRLYATGYGSVELNWRDTWV